MAVVGERPRGKTAALDEFSRRVRAFREAAGLTQEDLAHYVHRAQLGHIEQGRTNPTLWSIIRVAKGLGVDPAHLVAGLDPGPDYPTRPTPTKSLRKIDA